MSLARTLFCSTALALAAMPAAQAASVTAVYALNGTNGASAAAGITPTGSGSYFVVTQSDSVSYAGAIDLFSPPAGTRKTWAVKRLSAFTLTGNPGYGPTGTLVVDSAGNAYGTVGSGGTNGCGGVYKLTKTTATTYTRAPIYVFKAKPDACAPWAGLTAGVAGTYYGTATGGGALGQGAVFQLVLNKTTNKWAEKVIYSFSGADGATPYGALLRLSDGSLIGTASAGGAAGNGNIFKLTPPATAGGAWGFTSIHDFSGGNDAGQPYGRLIAGAAGQLYGAAYGVFDPVHGGTGPSTIFRLQPNAASPGGYSYGVIYTFDASFGTGVFGDLAFTAAGSLVGTTQNGGPNNAGTVWVLDPPAGGGSGGWTLNTTSSLQLPDGVGVTPYAGLTAFGSSFLGSTFSSGTYGYGAVFQFTP